MIIIIIIDPVISHLSKTFYMLEQMLFYMFPFIYPHNNPIS